jgi:hypothetical protein
MTAGREKRLADNFTSSVALNENGPRAAGVAVSPLGEAHRAGLLNYSNYRKKEHTVAPLVPGMPAMVWAAAGFDADLG